jgi:hypothetical protein
VLRAPEVVEAEIALGPVEVGVGKVHAGGGFRAAGGGVHRERAGVAEQIKEPAASRLLADHGAGETVVEEEAGVDVVAEIHLELQAALLHDERLAGFALLLVLREPALAVLLLGVHAFNVYSDGFRD